MKTQRKRGFTVIELVIVIAVVAVLAAVLIPTFVSIIKKANESAYIQERQSQRIEDIAEKLDNENWLSWEDFEVALAQKMANYNPQGGETITEEDLKLAIKNALAGYETGLTEESVKKIVDQALAGQLTQAQVEALIRSSLANQTSAPNIESIVSQVLARIPQQTGITLSQLNAALANITHPEGITDAQIKKLIEDALSGIQTYTEDDIKAIVEAILANQGGGETGDAVVINTYDNDDGENYSLLMALEEASAGDTIKLGADITVTEVLEITKDVTIDLNGKTLQYISEEADDIIYINGAEVTLKNGTITGKLNESGSGICVDGDSSNHAKLSLKNINLDFAADEGEEVFGLYVGSYSDITMDGGSISMPGDASVTYTGSNSKITNGGQYSLICFDGNYSNNSTVTITGATLNLAGTGCVYVVLAQGTGGTNPKVPNNVNAVIKDCTVNIDCNDALDCAICELRGDVDLTIENTTVTGTMKDDDGASYLYTTRLYTGNLVLTGNNIFNATFDGEPIDQYSGTNIQITGGKYNFDPSGVVPSGFEATDNGDGTYTVSKN